ncbi:hypothetical protein [Streptomyces sp. NPDC012888]|uniref:hypothetical protein n=1 Tax=Streptomyces sp. NPDC012888 TaxID=3364855 RepID=UPI003688A905
MKFTLICFGALFVLWGIGVSDEHNERMAKAATKAATTADKAGKTAKEKAVAVQAAKDAAIPTREYLTVMGNLLTLAAIGGAMVFVGRSRDQYEGLRDGHTEDDDKVVTKALDLLPPLADVVHAQVGRPRVEALNAVHSKAAALMKAVVDHSDAAGRLGAYAADRDKLKEHGRKVSAALSAMLGDMVRDRDTAAPQLAALTLTIAERQAQATYGALLEDTALAPDPGPEEQDARVLRTVFVGAAVVAGVALVVSVMAGGEGANLLFIPLVVGLVSAFVIAAFTKALGPLGRVLATVFGREGSPGGGAP